MSQWQFSIPMVQSHDKMMPSLRSDKSIGYNRTCHYNVCVDSDDSYSYDLLWLYLENCGGDYHLAIHVTM